MCWTWVCLFVGTPMVVAAQAAPEISPQVSLVAGASFNDFEERFPFSPLVSVRGEVVARAGLLRLGVGGEVGLTEVWYGQSCALVSPCGRSEDPEAQEFLAANGSVGVGLGELDVYASLHRARVFYPGERAVWETGAAVGIRVPSASRAVPRWVEWRTRKDRRYRNLDFRTHELVVGFVIFGR